MVDLDPLYYNFVGRIQQKIFEDLREQKTLPLIYFKHAYVNPEIGRNVLKKMVNSKVARIDDKTQKVHFVPPEERKQQ